MLMVDDILNHGVLGSSASYLSWVNMFCELSAIQIPKHIADFNPELENLFRDKFISRRSTYSKESSRLNSEGILNYLENKVSKKEVSKVKENQEVKYQIADLKKCSFISQSKEIIFIGKEFHHHPVGFMHSKLKNWLKQAGAEEGDIMDICIGVTEAIENAVKYSSSSPIVVQHAIEDGIYKIVMVNSAPKISHEINEKQFSKSNSLMKGLIIMSRVFENFDIDRDVNLVHLKASKSIL